MSECISNLLMAFYAKNACRFKYITHLFYLICVIHTQKREVCSMYMYIRGYTFLYDSLSDPDKYEAVYTRNILVF